MAKVLELTGIESGSAYQPAYHVELFKWLQRPDGWHVPRLELGHRAVLGVAFDGKGLTEIARDITDFDDPAQRTGMQLLVAGVDYETIIDSDISPDLAGPLDDIGAITRAHKHARNDGEPGNRYGYADVFTANNYRANEALLWFEGVQPQPDTLNGYALNRIAKITKEDDVAKAKESIDRMRKGDYRLARLILSGFRSAVLLADYDKQAVQDTAEGLSRSIQKRYAYSSNALIKRLLDNKRTAHDLARLPRREDWGTDVACDKKDDRLLELPPGKSAVDPRARILCGSCAVRLYCLRDSLYDDAPVVRGGLSGAERRRLRNAMGLEEIAEHEETDNELVESA